MRILDLCIVIGLAFPAQSVADDHRDKELADRSPYEVDLALDLAATTGVLRVEAGKHFWAPPSSNTGSALA